MDAKRPRGRPKADEPGRSLTTWLTTREHDQLIALATREAKTVSGLVRELVARKLATAPRD